MKIKIDKTANALYVRLKKGAVWKTKNEGGRIADYDKQGNLIGFEILNISRKAPDGAAASKDVVARAS